MKFTIYIFLLFQSLQVFSQGCSDAGFCTMGAMRPNQKFNKMMNIKLRSIEYTSYWGLTDFKNFRRY